MGLLDRLFPKPDPTAAWLAEPGLRIQFDFGRHALCGVKIGDPVGWLSGLGRAEDPRAARQGRFCYYSKGLELGAEGGTTSSYLLVWDEAANPGYLSFAGVCTYRGQELGLNPGTGEAEIRRCFGSPYWRDEDQDEILIFYEFQQIEWQVELTLRGTLSAVLIVSPPLLSDEAQRKAYRVTKPWPPSLA